LARIRNSPRNPSCGTSGWIHEVGLLRYTLETKVSSAASATSPRSSVCRDRHSAAPREDFSSRDDLIAKLDTYVINHNTTAKPYRWTYDGTLLKVT
jgi:hypothetical protein